MNKQPEITDATRQRILDSFWNIFQTTPLEKITVGQISTGADIHRSSFYRYFTDVYQVLDAFQNQLLEALIAETAQIRDTVSITLPAYTEKISVILVRHADKLYRMLNYKDSTFKRHFSESARPNIEKYLHITSDALDAEYLTTFIVSCMLTNNNLKYEIS